MEHDLEGAAVLILACRFWLIPSRPRTSHGEDMVYCLVAAVHIPCLAVAISLEDGWPHRSSRSPISQVLAPHAT